MAKACKFCGMEGHTATFCYAKPKQKIKKANNVKKGYHLHDTKWIRFRAQWIKDNPEPWYCHYCGGYLANTKELTLDHKIPKSGLGIGQKYDEANIVPCCYKCNVDKGSIHYDRYMEILRKRRQK